MNSEKYIGLDVHQATISVAVLDSTGKLVMGSILETKAATILEFFAGLRGTLSVTLERNLGRVAVRFTEVACGQAGGVQSAKKCSAQRRKQK